MNGPFFRSTANPARHHRQHQRLWKSKFCASGKRAVSPSHWIHVTFSSTTHQPECWALSIFHRQSIDRRPHIFWGCCFLNCRRLPILNIAVRRTVLNTRPEYSGAIKYSHWTMLDWWVPLLFAIAMPSYPVFAVRCTTYTCHNSGYLSSVVDNTALSQLQNYYLLMFDLLGRWLKFSLVRYESYFGHHTVQAHRTVKFDTGKW